MTVRTALIIGGGVAGPATALALQKVGVEATVFEAHAGGADGIGTFLTLATNGIDALRAIDLDGPTVAAGFATPAMLMRNSAGKALGEVTTGYPLPDGTASHTLLRAELYRVLRDEAVRRGIEIRPGRRLTSVAETPDGVTAMFQDGSSATAELLVGADGLNSTVRRIIDPSAPVPRFAGLLNTGGIARGVDLDVEPGRYEMIFGRRGFFGFTVDPDGEVWWFANVPAGSDVVSGADPRGMLLDLFADDAGPAVELITATSSLMPLSPIHTVPHLKHWHRGRLVLVGDAVHAPSPSSGQGASLSIEDAVELARCLRYTADVPTAFQAFEAARRKRVEGIIKWAARVNSSKAAGPIGAKIRDAMMPTVLRMTADSKANQRIYRHHIDWDAPVAAR